MLATQSVIGRGSHGSDESADWRPPCGNCALQEGGRGDLEISYERPMPAVLPMTLRTIGRTESRTYGQKQEG